MTQRKTHKEHKGGIKIMATKKAGLNQVLPYICFKNIPIQQVFLLILFLQWKFQQEVFLPQ